LLAKKPEMVVFTKADLRTKEEVDELLEHVKDKVDAYAVTVLDDESVKKFE